MVNPSLFRGAGARLLALAGLVWLAGCAAAAGSKAVSPPTVGGTVSYRERLALPKDAVLEVSLLDISRMDAPAEVLGRQRLQPVPGPVTRFRISYDPAAINPNSRYSVRATIRVADQLWFTTDTVAHVLTQGAPSEVELLLHRVPPDVPPAPLTNTYWRLTEIEGRPIAAALQQREPQMVLADLEGRRDLRGQFGCNRLGGHHEERDGVVQLHWTQATRMACPGERGEQEARVRQVLSVPLHWRITGHQLDLTRGDGTPAARFEAVYLP